VDNYLHEAALANDPPSRTFYCPDRDGVPLPSLGVHEHWNNPIDRQYSRNLGLDVGIELVAIRLHAMGEFDGDLVRDGVVNERDLAAFCRGWLARPGDSSWSAAFDLSSDQRTDFLDWVHLARQWGQRTRPGESDVGLNAGRVVLDEGRLTALWKSKACREDAASEKWKSPSSTWSGRCKSWKSGLRVGRRHTSASPT